MENKDDLFPQPDRNLTKEFKRPHYFIWSILILAVIVLGLVGWFYHFQNQSQDENLIACTADAMQCPDGTWVGRSGPNCEFMCPEVLNNDLQTYKDDELNLEFMYPKELSVSNIDEDGIWVWTKEDPITGFTPKGGVRVSRTGSTDFDIELKNRKDAVNRGGLTTYGEPEIVLINRERVIKQSFVPYEGAGPGHVYVFPERGLFLQISEFYEDVVLGSLSFTE